MPQAAVAAVPDTKAALLDAAERLFAEHGVSAASLRAITRAAGANLAAVHYHFGSKEGLVRAVLARRLEPLNRERLELLAECADLHGERAVRAIVEAFVGPPIRMIRAEPGGPAFAQLVARSFLEPAAATRELVLDQFREVIERFTEALGRALPAVPAAEILWRFHFMAGSMSFTLGLGFLVERHAGTPAGSTDSRLVAERLANFVAAGMAQPPTAPEAGR